MPNIAAMTCWRRLRPTCEPEQRARHLHPPRHIEDLVLLAGAVTGLSCRDPLFVLRGEPIDRRPTREYAESSPAPPFGDGVSGAPAVPIAAIALTSTRDIAATITRTSSGSGSAARRAGSPRPYGAR